MSRPRIRIRHRPRRPKKESKRIPIWGSPERGDGLDHGRYFECWNCGAICDSDRDFLGDSESSARITPTAYNQTDEKGSAVYHCQGKLAGSNTNQTDCEAAGGTWSRVRYEPVVESGCWFCGSTNYRGDYP